MEKKRLIISTNELNRYKGRVIGAGGRFENYRKNPVLLFGHQSANLPIGRLEDIQIEANGNVTGLPVFDEADEFAVQVKRKWETGFLFAASIFFEPIICSSNPADLLPGQLLETALEWELLEVSMVTLPGNGGAAIGLSADLVPSKAIPPISPIIINQDMDLKKLAIALGLPESATEEECLAAANKLTTDVQQSHKDKVETMLALGTTNGLVNDTNRDQWRKLGMADYANTNALIVATKAPQTVDAPPPAPGTTLSGMIQSGGTKVETKLDGERAGWTFDDWSRKDEKGLLKMKKEDPTRYQALAADKLTAATV